MAKNYWLVKQEPESYSWDTFVKEGGTNWTGVRNFQARNHLRSMKRGDLVLFYHSVSEKRVVGIAKVTREAFPDPTATEGDWSCVTLAPVKPLAKPVTLEQIKSDKLLRNLPLVKQGRLSVMPVAPREFEKMLKLGETRL
jgi:predicted RNA-binding protein with PUA-like domain